MNVVVFFFVKQKTAYEIRISDWSSDVCSSDLEWRRDGGAVVRVERRRHWSDEEKLAILKETTQPGAIMAVVARRYGIGTGQLYTWRSEERRVGKECGSPSRSRRTTEH